MASKSEDHDLKKGSNKRKAAESPETDKPFPRLRRRASLPNLQDATEPKKSYSLLELMKRGFLDPDIMKGIVPTMMEQLAPSIEETIRIAMETTLATTISSCIEKSMNVYKTEVIKPLIDKKDAEISTLKAELKQTTNKVKELETKANKLTQSMNDLEQYGRRQNI